MDKKGVSLSINTLVIVVLALLVLVILGYVFSTQIHSTTKQYMNLSLETEKEIKAKNVCEKLFSGRECLPKEECTKRNYKDLGTEWTDCKLDGLFCCSSS